ncbi:MAG: Rho termination factor N-terminal domain-containing protein, partial [Promethearchaeota archaeon]
MSKKLDDKTYLKYLLQSLNADDLKQICRDFEIKGFSKFKKSELIDFILDSLAEEELKDLLKQKEGDIISNEIDTAIKKINGEDRESITEIKVVNDKNHEIEIKFKGFNWKSSSYLSITSKNILDPERDCDCRVGSNMGFCNHFWVGFIYSLKKNYFKLSEWKLTTLPKDFEKNMENIFIKDSILINEGAPSSLLARYKRI